MYSQPRGREAEGLEAAAMELPPGDFPRAELLRASVEFWRRRGLLDDAERCARASIADGGRTWIDPRADLLGVLLDRGDPTTDEVARRLRRDLDAVPLPLTMVQPLGEELVEAGRRRDALRWYNLALRDVEPDEVVDDEDLDVTLVLRGRYQVRRALRLNPDPFDLAAERTDGQLKKMGRAI